MFEWLSFQLQKGHFSYLILENEKKTGAIIIGDATPEIDIQIGGVKWNKLRQSNG